MCLWSAILRTHIKGESNYKNYSGECMIFLVPILDIKTKMLILHYGCGEDQMSSVTENILAAREASALSRRPTTDCNSKLSASMDNIKLKGLGVALVTPFNSSKEIDFEALERMVEYLISGNVDYLVVLGTTGETPTLSNEERILVRHFVAEKVNRRIPLIVGMGSNCTASLVNELQSADLSGYSAILSVTPFYNKPSQEGLYRHYRAVIDASPLPVILYNVPGRTGINISSETTLRLAHESERIIGIKEASGNFKQIEEIIHGRPEGFSVISGDDSLTFPLMTLGAEGVISVVGNAFPVEFGRMVRLCLEGDYRSALPIHYRFNRLYEELFVDGNPAGVKSILHDMGLIENELRLPLVPTRLETGEELRRILADLKEGTFCK